MILLEYNKPVSVAEFTGRLQRFKKHFCSISLRMTPEGLIGFPGSYDANLDNLEPLPDGVTELCFTPERIPSRAEHLLHEIRSFFRRGSDCLEIIAERTSLSIRWA